MKPACSLQVNLIIILTHGYQGLAAPGALARRASAFGWARHRLFPDSAGATPGLGWSWKLSLGIKQPNRTAGETDYGRQRF